MADRLVPALQFKKGNFFPANPADARTRFISHGSLYDAPDSLRARASRFYRNAQRRCGNGRNVYRRESPRSKGQWGGNKICVVSLVERGGNARSVVLDRVTSKNLRGAIMEHVQDGSTVVTDDFMGYCNMPKIFTHKSVKHSAKEYVRRKKGSTFTPIRLNQNSRC